MLSIYRNIKRLREERGWSQTDLALKAGYKDKTAISKIESGIVDLKQSKIVQFANVFGVSVSDLMGDDGCYPDICETEAEIILAYRQAPDYVKSAIRQLLHINYTASEESTLEALK